MTDPIANSENLRELKRLKAKRAAVDDLDIRRALDLSIRDLEAKISTAAAEEQSSMAVAESIPADAAPLTEATSSQIREAEDLIRQSRVEKMRKNSARASALLLEAAGVAPNSASVLEALGDEYMEKRQYRDAVTVYQRAVKLSKNNIELERKHGVAVLRSRGLSYLDAGNRLDAGDSLFLTSDTSPATIKGARILNAFVPGVGHMVAGRPAAGLAILAAAVVCIVWLIAMQHDLQSLISMVAGKSKQPNLLVLAPLFGLIVTYIVGLTSLGVDPARKLKQPVIRPQPPVDLPFE